MAYDKRPGHPGGGGSGTKGGTKGRGGHGERSAGGPFQGKAGDRKPERGPAPAHYGAPRRDGRPGYREDDEVFHGASTRPMKPNAKGEAFFGRGAGPSKDRPRPMGQGPRRAAPSARPVPPAVKDDGPMPERAPDYPFKSRPRPEQRPRDGSEPRFAPRSEADQARENILAGRNPIREAIKAGRPMEKLLVAEGDLSGSARQIVSWAREAHVVVQYVHRSRLDQIYPNHQGMIAFVSMAEYKSVDDILAFAAQRGEDPFVVVLDSITDPHNLGAIIRTAECAGAHGVIIPERRSAGLNPAAVKASAGASEYQRVAKVVNLSRTLQELKQKGLWIIGADMGGEPVNAVDLSGPIALVIGAEGEGISDLVLRQCDLKVALPIRGRIDSLNASVAAGVMMYEVLRARGGR